MGIPENWKRTKRPPVVVDGYEFLSYRAGIAAYELYCEAISATVSSNAANTSYGAWINGSPVLSPRTGKPHRFTTERKAIEGAIAEARKGV